MDASGSVPATANQPVLIYTIMRDISRQSDGKCFAGSGGTLPRTLYGLPRRD